MGRLPGFDYKRPFFYMVTIVARRSGRLQNRGRLQNPPFCSISEDGTVVANTITEAFERVIRHFHETWYCIEPIRCYVIMPDHLHLIIKMRDIEKRVSLAVVVRQLIKALECCAGGATAKPVLQGSLREPLFEHEWHDWIVKKEGQLAAFRKYIAENPPRHARRRANRQYFTKARQIVFRGKRYWAYGNEALLELPMIVAIKGHRRPVLQGALRAPDAAAEQPLQNRLDAAALMAAASRIGPGGAGLSTFLSPLERMPAIPSSRPEAR